MDIYDKIELATQDGIIAPEKKKEILKLLIDASLNLSNDSKKTNFAIGKLLGVM